MLPAMAQVTITSPAASSTSISAVDIAANSSEGGSYHLEIWDNGYKLGNVFATSVNGAYVLPNGTHTLTVNAVTSSGSVIGTDSVTFNVAEDCTTSDTVQCNMDQQGIDNQQKNCAPRRRLRGSPIPAGAASRARAGANRPAPASPTSRNPEPSLRAALLPAVL